MSTWFHVKPEALGKSAKQELRTDSASGQVIHARGSMRANPCETGSCSCRVLEATAHKYESARQQHWGRQRTLLVTFGRCTRNTVNAWRRDVFGTSVASSTCPKPAGHATGCQYVHQQWLC